MDDKDDIKIEFVKLGECNFKAPTKCPECESSDIEEDFLYHDHDFRFRAVHTWMCGNCLEGDLEHCLDPQHRADIDEEFAKYLETNPPFIVLK